MRSMLASIVLMLTATSVFASPTLPEPETLTLLGIGFAAMLMVRRNKK